MKTRIGYKKIVLLGFVLVLALCFGLAGAVHAKTEKKADKKQEEATEEEESDSDDNREEVAKSDTPK